MAACGNDLQLFIATIKQKRDKLLFLKEKVEDKELVAILLKGLHSLFQPRQVYFRVPTSTPKTLEDTIAIVRRFASTPAIQAELTRLKSGTLQQGVFNLPTSAATKSKAVCKHFMTKGRCGFGDKCRFQHVTGGAKPEANEERRGSFCKRCKSRHPFGACRRTANEATLVAASDLKSNEEVEMTIHAPAEAEDSASYDLFVLTTEEIALTAVTQEKKADSGATVSATFDEADCYDVVDCNIRLRCAQERKS